MKSYGNWGVMTKRGRGLEKVTIIPGFLTLADPVIAVGIFLVIFAISVLISGVFKYLFLLFGLYVSFVAIMPAKNHYHKKRWKIALMAIRKTPREFKSENKNLMRELMK